MSKLNLAMDLVPIFLATPPKEWHFVLAKVVSLVTIIQIDYSKTNSTVVFTPIKNHRGWYMSMKVDEVEIRHPAGEDWLSFVMTTEEEELSRQLCQVLHPVNVQHLRDSLNGQQPKPVVKVDSLPPLGQMNNDAFIQMNGGYIKEVVSSVT